MDELLKADVELTLKVSELVDLIEVGAIAHSLTGHEPAIVAELRELFTTFVRDLDEAVNEV
jgi:uncharacterized protein Yka (UPF0111/DUF47 family)